MATKSVSIEIGGREVVVTNPDKVYFPEMGYTKLDLVNYYVAVGEAALQGVMHRPMVLKRFVDGAAGEPFFQKRAPANLPPWIHTARVHFPSGRFADLTVADEPGDIAWAANLGCIDLNPWPVRETDVDHPDELRIDLDPTPEAGFGAVKQTAMVVKEVLDDLGYVGLRQDFRLARHPHLHPHRAALGVSPDASRGPRSRPRSRASSAGAHHHRLVERRAPRRLHRLQPERARPHRRFRLLRAPDAGRARLLPDRLGGAARRRAGRLHDRDRADTPAQSLATHRRSIDDVSFSLEPLLELVGKQEREGLGDAPWPPQFPKAAGEPKRVQPSRARKGDSDAAKDDAPKSRPPVAGLRRSR